MYDSQQALDLLGPLPDPERIIERQTIGFKLTALGIRPPHPHSENGIHVRFLATILPYARNGDVHSARQAVEKYFGGKA